MIQSLPDAARSIRRTLLKLLAHLRPANQTPNKKRKKRRLIEPEVQRRLDSYKAHIATSKLSVTRTSSQEQPERMLESV